MSKTAVPDTKKLRQELDQYNKRLVDLRKRFMKGGIDKNEQAQLDVLSKKIATLQKALHIVVIDEDEAYVIVARQFKGDPGIPFEQQIVNILQIYKDAIQDYWQNYLLGVENFQTRMQFSSDQEATPQYLQAVFKSIAKEAFMIGLKEVGSHLGEFAGPFGHIVSVSKAGIEAWMNEKERVTAAQGQVKIADYIESLRNGIPKQRDAMSDAVDKNKGTIIDEFRAAAKGMIAKDGSVLGEGAQIMNDLKSSVASFKKSMPQPPYFQQQFATKFADTPGRTDLVSHGGIASGTIYLSVRLVVDPDDDEKPWKEGKTGEAWRLVTSAPNPDRVATSLARSLEGKKPWQIDLPKMVEITVEIEEFGPNGVQEGYIYFTKSPDQFEVRSNYGDKWFREAWMTDGIRRQILEVDKLVGSSK